MNKQTLEEEYLILKQMYDWLHKGFKQLELRHAEILEENRKLTYILLRDKDV